MLMAPLIYIRDLVQRHCMEGGGKNLLIAPTWKCFSKFGFKCKGGRLDKDHSGNTRIELAF